MGMKTHFCKAGFLLYLLCFSQALADEPLAPLHFVGRYDFNWSGIELGTLVLSIDEDGDQYKMHLAVASEGIVNLFTRHMSDTVANGKHVGNSYQPVFYESYYKTKKKPRHIRLAFDDKGVVTEEFNEPPEDRNDRPEVPHNLKDGAVDPLSLIMMMRAGAKDVKAFDAKRLYEVKAGREGKDTLYTENKWQKANFLTLSRTPLAGLTAKETKEYNKGEPAMAFYFSADARRIPLAMSVPIMLGDVSGVLVKECKSWAECGLTVDAK